MLAEASSQDRISPTVMKISDFAEGWRSLVSELESQVAAPRADDQDLTTKLVQLDNMMISLKAARAGACQAPPCFGIEGPSSLAAAAEPVPIHVGMKVVLYNLNFGDLNL